MNKEKSRCDICERRRVTLIRKISGRWVSICDKCLKDLQK